LEARGDV
jgi:hypothetical protein